MCRYVTAVQAFESSVTDLRILYKNENAEAAFTGTFENIQRFKNLKCNVDTKVESEAER